MGQTLLWLIIIIAQVSPHRVRQSFLSPHVELIQIPMYFMVVVLWWLIHLCSHRSQIYSNFSEAFNGCSTSRYDEVDDLSSVIVNKLHCMGVGMPRIFKEFTLYRPPRTFLRRLIIIDHLPLGGVSVNKKRQFHFSIQRIAVNLWCTAHGCLAI